MAQTVYITALGQQAGRSIAASRVDGTTSLGTPRDLVSAVILEIEPPSRRDPDMRAEVHPLTRSHLHPADITDIYPYNRANASSAASAWRRACATTHRRVARSTAITVQPLPSSSLRWTSRVPGLCSTRTR